MPRIERDTASDYRNCWSVIAVEGWPILSQCPCLAFWYYIFFKDFEMWRLRLWPSDPQVNILKLIKSRFLTKEGFSIKFFPDCLKISSNAWLAKRSMKLRGETSTAFWAPLTSTLWAFRVKPCPRASNLTWLNQIFKISAWTSSRFYPNNHIERAQILAWA